MYPLSGVKANVDHLWEDSKVGLKWNRENENVCVYNGSVKRTVQEALGWTFGVFQAFFEDEKESRINGWRRKRRRSRHFCPQCGQLTGGSTQSVVAPFERTFGTAGVLVPANAGVPRILVVPCGRFRRKSR